MKKLITALLILTLIAGFFASCKPSDPAQSTPSGSNSESTPAETEPGNTPIPEFDFMNEDLTKYVTLGTYKGHTFEVDPVKYMTEEEFARQLVYELALYGCYDKITDRAVLESDIVGISYVGYMDGEKFKGGEGKSDVFSVYDGGGFIDGFAAGIIGAMPGVETDVNVTFPEDYHAEELAGKPATFKVTVNYICSVHELTDELIKELSNGEMKTAQEFIDAADKLMRQDAEAIYESNKLTAVWEKINSESVKISLPDGLVDQYYNYTIQYYQQYANQYLMTLDAFLKANGMTRESVRADAESDVFTDLIVYSLIKAESITLTDDDYKAQLAEFVEETGAPEEEILKVYPEEELRDMFLYTKAYESVLEWNTFTDKVGE